MSIKNLYGWNNNSAKANVLGSACGAGEKAAACGAQDAPAKKPSACGSACGAGNKPAKSSACGAGEK